MRGPRMKYKVGMYGGSFDPLHVGHIHDIIKAASLCEELYVIISWCTGRESTAKELRYRWILNCTSHLPNVRLRLIEDKAISKEVYNSDYYWEQAHGTSRPQSESPLMRCSAAATIWGATALNRCTPQKVTSFTLTGLRSPSAPRRFGIGDRKSVV